MDDLLEFTIPDWALSSLINGDDSGLEEEDIEKIDKFVNRIVEKYGNALFILPYEDEMDLGFQGYNDIDRLGSDCSLLYLRPSKPYAHGGTTDETIYIYEDKEYSTDEMIKLADEMAYYENEDYNEGVVVDNLYSAIAFLGEDEVKIKGDVVEGEGKLVYDREEYNKLLSKYDSIGAMLEDATSESERMAYKKQLEKLESMLHRYERGYADGGMMARGGMLEHGLRVGDEIIDVSDIDPSFIRVKNNGKYAYVNLSRGTRKETFADGGMMAKGGVHKVNRKYAYFAVNKKTNKIVDGWEIVDDVESLKYYAKMDLEDNDMNPKDYNLLSAKTLKARGIDPYSWDSWAKTGEYRMGGTTFQNKVDAIAENLEGTKVKPKYQKENGKTYNKMESVEAAKRIAGAMMKK
jgi:hypothetical protein